MTTNKINKYHEPILSVLSISANLSTYTEHTPSLCPNTGIRPAACSCMDRTRSYEPRGITKSILSSNERSSLTSSRPSTYMYNGSLCDLFKMSIIMIMYQLNSITAVI